MSCNSKSNISDAVKRNKKPSFQCFYEGFKTVKTEHATSFPKGTLVFTSQPELNIFINKYLTNIPVDTTIDFSNLYL